MSSKDIARRAELSICFAGVDISADIKKYLKSFTYTDAEEDEADNIEISLHDRENVWLEKWLNVAIQGAADTGQADLYETADNDATEDIYKVTARSGLNIRTGPGTGYSKAGCYSYGTSVTVYGWSNDWAKVRFKDSLMYVSGSYLSYVGAAADASASQEKVGTTVKGLRIQAVIARCNWTGDGSDQVLDCGEFELDSVEASGTPNEITIKGTALPYSSTIRQMKKCKAWEKYVLSKIAQEIGDKNGLGVLYLAANDPSYVRVEQINISDIAFLSKLCHDAGISLKTTNNSIVLFDQAVYESADSVLTIQRGAAGGYGKHKLQTGESDTQYAICQVEYTDPATGKVIQGIAYADDYDADKEKNQTLEIRQKVTSIAEAEQLAKAQLRLHNKFEKSGTFTLPGNPGLVAGQTVTLWGWGAFDGKYIISKATHKVSETDGYTTQITLRVSAGE